MDISVASLAGIIASSSSFPLLATGSGGSLTAASIAARLHQKFAGKIAKSVTPLEVLPAAAELKETAALLISAGGKNSDIIAAFKQLIGHEPRRLVVICASTDSPLSKLAREYRHVDLIDFNLPVGQDGFLATNSLLAFSVILTRAYETAFAVTQPLPSTLGGLAYPSSTQNGLRRQLRHLCQPLWERETLIVLYGTSTQPAALDLESKFTEAALGSLQMADYRNFAHGRHHWLAKKGTSTAVLALATQADSDLADKTLRLLPESIPVARIDIPQKGPRASLASLVYAMEIAGLAGEARGIDPGRPGVPTFGQKLYNLRAISKSADFNPSTRSLEEVSIERKTGLRIDTLDRGNEVAYWMRAYRVFVEELAAATFCAVVFDYDGTLCDGRNRYIGLDEGIVNQLERLLEAGIIVGVATGRGKSVKEAFERQVKPHLWPRVVLGYYNGAYIGPLTEDIDPSATEAPCMALKAVASALSSNSWLNAIALCTYRHMQITIEPKTSLLDGRVWDVVQQITRSVGDDCLGVLRSSHSMDIIAPGVSKRHLVERVRRMISGAKSETVLCIGDRGRWPGNDFALLSERFALSVDDVSPDPKTCWNIAPPGHRGVQATLGYLDAMEVTHESLRIHIDSRQLGKHL
ncbi:MAG: HAD hydrolase family protein [Blastocatellia bacterium]